MYEENIIRVLKCDEYNPENITIIGRRWFQRSYGNTYFSVEIFNNNELIAKVPYEYGYGDQYRQAAFEILREMGLYSMIMDDRGIYPDWEQLRDDSHNMLIVCHDVNTKREL